jgi:hypothetical protein
MERHHEAYFPSNYFNSSNIILNVRTVTMFVNASEKNVPYHIYRNIYGLYAYEISQISTVSLVTAVKPKAKYRIREPVMLLFHIPQKITSRNIAYFLNTNFQDPALSDT